MLLFFLSLPSLECCHDTYQAGRKEIVNLQAISSCGLAEDLSDEPFMLFCMENNDKEENGRFSIEGIFYPLCDYLCAVPSPPPQVDQ